MVWEVVALDFDPPTTAAMRNLAEEGMRPCGAKLIRTGEEKSNGRRTEKKQKRRLHHDAKGDCAIMFQQMEGQPLDLPRGEYVQTKPPKSSCSSAKVGAHFRFFRYADPPMGVDKAKSAPYRTKAKASEANSVKLHSEEAARSAVNETRDACNRYSHTGCGEAASGCYEIAGHLRFGKKGLNRRVCGG